jgi:chitodextrinase
VLLLKSTAKVNYPNQKLMKFSFLLLATMLFGLNHSFGQSGCAMPAKLVLTTAMVTSENGGNAQLLVDEQSSSGDPAQGSGGTPGTVWEPASYPGSAYIDLGTSTNITSIYLRDVNNIGDFIVSTGSPGNWTPLFTEDCGAYLSWKQHNVSITTRHLRFTRDGGANVSEVIIYGCSGTNPGGEGTITYQKWSAINGTAVTDLTGNPAYPNSPSSTSSLTSFEGPTNADDFYGARIIGYITAPQTGSYTFWIAGDDNAELWLSTGSSPANKQKIAYHNDWTNSKEWNKHATQKSGAITLTAGTKYFVEALLKENWGGDNLAAGWRKPSDGSGTSPAEVIPGSVLSPYTGVPSDTQAPSTPSGFVSSSVTSNSVNLNWNASTDNVGVTGYEVFRDGSLLATVTATNTSATGLTASTSYTFKVRAKDAAGNSSAFTNDISVTTLPSGGPDGVISFQRWNNIPGTAVTDLTSHPAFPNSPTSLSDLSYFETPYDLGDNYGARVIGYITAPQTGTYYFWIAGDDQVELWLSTTNSPGNKVKIAHHEVWTFPREWNKVATQKSAAITLTAGAKYYVEALVKEALNSDNLSVGWRKPSDGPGTDPAEIIPGTVLSRFFAPDTQAPTAPTALQSPAKSASSVSLSWTASTDNYGIAGYDVYRGTTKVNTSLIAGTNYVVTGLTPATTYTFSVIAKDAASNASPGSNSITVTTNAPDLLSKPRIAITESMIINESGLRDDRGSFFNLFDEQSTITNYAPEGPAVTHWRVGGDAAYYPAGLIIDLGQEYDINNIYWFDGKPRAHNGVDIEVKGGRLEIETGAPFNWTSRYQHTLANDSAWHHNSTAFRTRYIHIKKHSTATYMWETYGPFTADAPLMELIIYGTPVGTPPPPPTNEHDPANIPMNVLVGGDSWWYGDTTTFNAVGMIRAYHPLSRSGSSNLTDPLDLQSYDEFYGRNLNASYEIYPCVQGHHNGSEDKPTYGGDPSLPETYRIHADNLWQWTARYGRNTNINVNLIRLPHWQTKHVGLGYLNFIENWNEQDRWWAGSAPYFTPYQFAAMSSADYDGHMGTMGNTVGVKNADPTMKVVMGGLASTSVDYIKGMKLWSDQYRNGSFPADVLNFHYYARLNGKGVSPEADNLLDRMQKIVEYRNYHLPGKEAWVTEFGWDVEGGSEQQANGHTQWPNNGYNSEQLQAIWLVRTYMIMAKAGIDRAQMYTIGDAGGWGTYATCGLVTYNGVKRKSWYFVATLKNRLKDMVYVGEVPSGNPNVWIYKFKSVNNNSGVYAVWSPTSDGTTVNNYQLSMGGNPTAAKQVTLTNGNIMGSETTLGISGNTVTINVSEAPVFISVNSMDGTVPQSAARVGRNETVTAVTSGEEGHFSVYPNPAKNNLQVSFEGHHGGELSLIDLRGMEHHRQVVSGNEAQVDVSKLKKGIYILKVRSGNASTSSKIIIE